MQSRPGVRNRQLVSVPHLHPAVTYAYINACDTPPERSASVSTCALVHAGFKSLQSRRTTREDTISVTEIRVVW
jgi:hypothetical protein